MSYEVGSVLEGKVTGITKFGVFVVLPDGKSGMVHISEVASTFVKEIRDHVSENQMVKVKIIGIDKNDKIALSMKRAVEEKKPVHAGNHPPANVDWINKNKPTALSFEDKLNKFKQDSEERMSGLKRHIEGKRGSSGKRGG